MSVISEQDNKHGVLVSRTTALPAQTNANGDVFGGWILAQMDLGGSVLARKKAGCRVVTVSIESMSFLNPISIGDLVSCYARVVHLGRTSITIGIETWVWRHETDEDQRVTSGRFKYVAIDAERKPNPVFTTS